VREPRSRSPAAGCIHKKKAGRQGRWPRRCVSPARARRHLYGDVYSSPGLGMRQKQVLMVAFLGQADMQEQLFGHLLAVRAPCAAAPTCGAMQHAPAAWCCVASQGLVLGGLPGVQPCTAKHTCLSWLCGLLLLPCSAGSARTLCSMHTNDNVGDHIPPMCMFEGQARLPVGGAYRAADAVLFVYRLRVSISNAMDVSAAARRPCASARAWRAASRPSTWASSARPRPAAACTRARSGRWRWCARRARLRACICLST